MRNVLTSVDSSDLVAMLEKTRLASESQEESAYSHAAGQLILNYCTSPVA